MQQSGKYQKSYQPANASTPAPAQSAPRTGTGNKPSKRLTVKSNGEYNDITGLFESVSKKSGKTYLAGTDRSSGTKYYVFTNTKKGSNEPDGYTLCVRQGEGDNAKFVTIAKLRDTKTGSLVGDSTAVAGDTFFVSEPKSRNA